MFSKLKSADVAVAVLIGAVIGGLFGLGVGAAARYFGWSTAFVAPLTGGLTGALVVIVYQRRSKPGGGV